MTHKAAAYEQVAQPGVKIHQGDWVVVCDGAKALILENTGDEKFLNLKTREVYAHQDPATHEQGTDAPGRSINSVGGARSAMEQTDWHERAEQAFLKGLMTRLDAALNAGQVKCLVMVAPPHALGVLRKAYSKHVREALRGEIEKDYVKMPLPEIEKHLGG
jgi:protein required for attachment to host cells